MLYYKLDRRGVSFKGQTSPFPLYEHNILMSDSPKLPKCSQFVDQFSSRFLFNASSHAMLGFMCYRTQPKTSFSLNLCLVIWSWPITTSTPCHIVIKMGVLATVDQVGSKPGAGKGAWDIPSRGYSGSWNLSNKLINLGEGRWLARDLEERVNPCPVFPCQGLMRGDVSRVHLSVSSSQHPH